MPRFRLLVPLLAAALVLVPSGAGSGVSGIAISQVFGGGGNAGAPYANDFVELFNRGSAAVDVGGWTIQYATAAGTTWQTTPLSGTIQPGSYFLVQLAGGTVGASLPAPDSSGSANLSATNGKIALVRDGAALTCGATPGSCSALPLVEDLIGYGTATDYEGAAAAVALSSTTAAIRGGGGCAETDDNASDFSAGAPSPRNTASTPQPCTTTPPPGSVSDAAAVDVDVEPVLSVSLERSTVSFGSTTAGARPAPISERVTVLSNHAAGYALTVQRSAFTPADLPLALQASAPAGGQLGSSFAGGGLVTVPIAPASATIGTTQATSEPAGDVWPTGVGFAGPIPAVPPGRYTATLTFTVIGR
jgi:Lamin Tail Domain